MKSDWINFWPRCLPWTSFTIRDYLGRSGNLISSQLVSGATWKELASWKILSIVFWPAVGGLLGPKRSWALKWPAKLGETAIRSLSDNEVRHPCRILRQSILWSKEQRYLECMTAYRTSELLLLSQRTAIVGDRGFFILKARNICLRKKSLKSFFFSDVLSSVFWL